MSTTTSDKFWEEAASTAPYLHNQPPKNNTISPHEKWFGYKYHIDKLISFTCKAWVRVPQALWVSKFGAVTWEEIMLVYENHALAYRLLRISDKWLIISKNVKFNESCFPSSTKFPAKKSLNTQILDLFLNLPFHCSSTNENTANEVDICSVEGEEFYRALEEQPTQRISVIGPRHSTLIAGEVFTKNSLPNRRSEHQEIKSTVQKSSHEAVRSDQCKEWKKEITKD
ncbi:hypothetical protein O181_051669 [Austropuccinia psidii MF-1]|uniref:Retroviral polymerase SH3-like domain-containing protein n=1 Tax=Austropuccinia psidii MF-1 TaxID=1389203 RepID=A0A9Q3DZ64_9BASI|nr:hypothetical protein [Austropuccinia psidii MF-1]